MWRKTDLVGAIESAPVDDVMKLIGVLEMKKIIAWNVGRTRWILWRKN